MTNNNGLYSRIESICRKAFYLLSLLACTAGCQDFTDDSGMEMPEPDLKFVEETLSLSLDEQECTVDVVSNLPWRVKTSASWIELLSSNGQGSGSFSISVSKNTDVLPREAEITGWIIEDEDTKLKVKQEGMGIALKRRALKVSSKGAEEVIPFTTMVSYTYELSEGCDWIHVTDGEAITPGIVNESSLKLKIDPNMSDQEEERSASLYLKGANGVVDELVITQDNKPLEDIDYLRMFYENANGDNWIKKWNFDAELKTDAENWPGVTVVGGRVTEIDFSSSGLLKNNIEGKITPLCYLSELTSLKFKHQKIEGIPEEIGLLTRLQTLWIIECGAGGNLPESLGNNAGLTSLNISNHPSNTPEGFNNTFTGNLDMLINISGIVTIKAYCNNFSGSLPVIPLDENNEPTTWNSLKEFIVYTNGFTGNIPYGYGTVIEKSGSSGIFRVANNQLNGQIPADLKAWSQYAKRKKAWILDGNSLTE